MYLADKMDMTDPDEYVYLDVMHNAEAETRLKWDGSKSRAAALNAYRPLLKVS